MPKKCSAKILKSVCVRPISRSPNQVPKWISDAMESADFSARTDDGRGYRLDRGRADEKCVIHCEDGNFTMPKMRLVFQ